MKNSLLLILSTCILFVTISSSLSPVPTQWGLVHEPLYPTNLCSVLRASLIVTGAGSVDPFDSDPSQSNPDTARIQSAIDDCPSGSAVKLIPGRNDESAFLSGPLQLKSGVTLWVDNGVTLFASRKPLDFDNGRGACGTATNSSHQSCKPLILAKDAVDSGIIGDGVIDGRGGSVLSNGPNAGKRSWWDVAYQSKQGLHQQVPRLLQVSKCANFTLHNITVLNSPNFHVAMDTVQGATLWGIKILAPSLVYTKPNYECPPGSTPDKQTPASCFTPDTVKNTDGFDPGQSSKVLMAYSYISVGDDNVAIKSSRGPGSVNMIFAHNHFYYGHGMSIGSETNGGVQNVIVTDLIVDGGDSPNSVGLRIKSDSSRGGDVTNVQYRRVCMRRVRRPLVFDAYYSQSTGSSYPNFTNITISGFHFLGSPNYAGGLVTFVGYGRSSDKQVPLEIKLDNVVFDGKQPTFEKGHHGAPHVLPATTHFQIGPGPVSFSNELVNSTERGVIVLGQAGPGDPVDCSDVFVPLKSVLPSSPI